MDNFEKHIRENKNLFDEHKVDKDKLWGAISKELKAEEPKVVPLWKSPMLKIAASILLLIGIGATAVLTVNRNTNSNASDFVSIELQEIDMHYKGLVAHQVLMVKNLTGLSEDDKIEFLSFMDELDEEYKILRLEMQNNLDNELVLEAIVSNYKKRIELIENLIQRIKSSKTQDDDYGYTL